MVSGKLVGVLLSVSLGATALGFAVYLQVFIVPEYTRLKLVDNQFLDNAQNMAMLLWVVGGVLVLAPLMMKGVKGVRRRRRYRR